eukprot:UN06160
MYDTIVTKRNMVNKNNSTDDNNNNAVAVEDDDDDDEFTSSAKPSTMQYDYTRHCYWLYHALRPDFIDIHIHLEHIAKLLTVPKEPEYKEFNAKVQKWCFGQLCTAYGGMSLCRQALYDYADGMINEKYLGFFNDITALRISYPICFALDVLEMIDENN